jgi:outer membrane protein TolC
VTQEEQFINILLKKIGFCFTVPILLTLSGQVAFALDLSTALQIAQENDASFKVEQMDAEAKRADGWVQVAALGPNLMASGKLMRSSLDYSPDDSAELEERHLTFNDDEIAIILEQPLIDLEKIYRALRGSCEMDIAAVELKKAREQLIVRVVERYFAQLSAQDELKLANAKLQILERQLETARANHTLGLEDQSALYDILARYETTKAISAVQEAKLVDAKEALAETLGQPVQKELNGLDEKESFFELPGNDFDYWLRLAKEHNVDCTISRLQSEAAQLDGKISASRFMPALSFFVEHERTSPDNDLNGYGWKRDRTDFGVKIQMELLSGGRDIANYVAREKRYKAARQRIIATQRSVVRQTTSTWKNLQRTLVSIEAYKQAMDANKKSLQIKEANFNEGLQTMLDVLNVQRDYFIVSNRYQNARYDYATTLIHFKQLVGTLSNTEMNLQTDAEL